MNELIHITHGILERGLIFAPTVAGVYLSSRLIRFDNLSIEGAFGVGGAFTALSVTQNINPWASMLIATAAGALTGFITGLLHTKLKLNHLISGIVVTTGLFSVMLTLAGSTLILTGKTIVTHYSLPILIGITIGTFLVIQWFLKTEIGLVLHAVGDSPQMVTNIGKSVHGYIIAGLALANALAALSGSLFVQQAGYFSIWGNVGVLIIGLAGLILAQVINNRFGTALIMGSIAYQAIIAMAFELQLNADWNKLITAMLIILLIIIKQWINKKEVHHVNS